MGDLAQQLMEWRQEGPGDPEHQLEFSLELRDGQTEAGVAEALRERVGDLTFDLRPAFLGALAAETGNRFWILAFPELDLDRAEAFAFETARTLREDLDLISVRPVLIESAIGEALARRELGLESSFLSCSVKQQGPDARGWAPLAIGAVRAWAQTRGEGVTVASIDTGYSDHLRLHDVISDKPQLNLVEGGSDAGDKFSTDVRLPNPGHGTLVASVVAGRGTVQPDGSTGGPNLMVGSAPGAKILPIRAIRSVVDLRQSRIPAAIEHAIAVGCDVIIMALGSAFPIQPVEVAIRAANRHGLVVVCAAGNCVGFVVFPARFAAQGLVTAVAGVDYAYKPWEKSSRGDSVTISAFGEGVWGARKNEASGDPDRIDRSEGTTLASSLTAGSAALWVAAHGGRAALKQRADACGVTVQAMFNEAITRTAWRPTGGWPRGMGAGLVNAAALIRHPLPEPQESLQAPPLPVDHVTPLSRYLQPVAEELDSLAGLEAATLPEDLAAEALTRLYRARSVRRMVAGDPGLESTTTSTAPTTPEFTAATDARPHLRALLR